MKMNIPWKVLNMVNRYAMTIEASLMKKRPKDQVRPSRQSKAKAPMTQDLKERERRPKKQKKGGRIQHERHLVISHDDGSGICNHHNYEKIGGKKL